MDTEKTILGWMSTTIIVDNYRFNRLIASEVARVCPIRTPFVWDRPNT